MLKEVIYKDGWVCFTKEEASFEITSIEQLIHEFEGFPVTLKHDKRSVVMRGRLFDMDVVAKQPVDKNRRKWSRLLSFLRNGEAKQSMLTLQRFAELGIPSVKPILVLEKRSYGVLVDSWIVYEYREGETSTRENTVEIIEVLKKLHSNNYRHDDPNPNNFLIDENKELFLIDCKGRKRVGTFTDNYDYHLLSTYDSGLSKQKVEELAGIDTSTLGYKLAEFYSGYKGFRTRLKKRIRK